MESKREWVFISTAAVKLTDQTRIDSELKRPWRWRLWAS